jgi:hypothetical protein
MSNPSITIAAGDVIDVDTPLGTISLTVSFAARPGTPPVDPQPNPQPVGKLHAVYYMMWSTSGSPKFADLPKSFNQVRLAFAQTSWDATLKRNVLRLVGSGSQDLATLKTSVQDARRRGVQVLISIGGQHGAVAIGTVDDFVRDIANISDSLGGLDGIDWDVEASVLDGQKVLAIDTALQKKFSNWVISYVPNGGNVGQYLPVAIASLKVGNNVIYGQQFYDTEVSVGGAEGRIKEAISAGIPASRIYVGMMNPDPRETASLNLKRWTVEQCVSNMTYLLGRYPLLGGALWEAGRKDSPRYAVEVGKVLGIAA